uniref:Uncharacterized protein n=1 Tax=Oryza rufipogon TaxID=4529 RepID=A0A0E0NI60_ORYRU
MKMTDTITTQRHKCKAEQRPQWSCRVFADRGPVSERCRSVGAKGRPGPPRRSGSSSSPARSEGQCLPQARRPAGRRSRLSRLFEPKLGFWTSDEIKNFNRAIYTLCKGIRIVL